MAGAGGGGGRGKVGPILAVVTPMFTLPVHRCFQEGVYIAYKSVTAYPTTQSEGGGYIVKE